MGQNLSISSVDPSRRRMVASSNPASKMLVRNGYSGRIETLRQNWVGYQMTSSPHSTGGATRYRMPQEPLGGYQWLTARSLMTPSWTTSRMHLGWILINQQPHSDIHAQREVMIEYRRISTAQGSSGIKWFQGWTSHQVTLGG
ncbi:hypothetical protein DFH08DRAFT_823373 [Mycena albidolilacea]|uniref:Uncharacterized protein n=1 Tax=Mycena albidolilacea TaxID=1033008 RepID=A0AAD6Z6N3_9AGAR|nr:hypothetical protein DFH08DRAFT_823373 [Mycena albidolilacea]